MKLHLPLALFAAIVCVSTPVTQANNYSNVSEYFRTEEKPNGIFEHSYDKTTGAVSITLHKGDFSAFDMYRSAASNKAEKDDAIILGASPLEDKDDYVNTYPSENKGVKSVTIDVNGATGINYIAGIGFKSCQVEEGPIEITMNSGTVNYIVGGVHYQSGVNDVASGIGEFAAKYEGDISIKVTGGTVTGIMGGHNNRSSEIVNLLSNATTEEYAKLMANKHWSVGGNISIEVTGGTVGYICGAGGDRYSVDKDVTVCVSGGKVEGDITGGPTNTYSEVGGNVYVEVTGNAIVGGNVYGTNIGTGKDGAAPCIEKNSSILIGGNAVVESNVLAVGNGGIVEGNTEVYLQDNAVVKGMVSGTGINGAKLNERSTSTLYVGTDEQAFTGSVGSIDGFSKVIVTKGSSLKMESGNVFAANEQVITLSAANLKDAALSGSSALVGENGLTLTILAGEPLASGKYKLVELSENNKLRATTTTGAQGWEDATVNGIASKNDTVWEGDILYFIYKQWNVDAAIVSNWGVFKSSQAFTGTLWGNRSNAVVLGSPAGTNDGKAPVAAAEQPTPAAHATTLAWASAYGQSGRISNAGADYSLYGAAMGIERQFGATGSSIGVAFGYDWGKVSPFTTTSADQETWHAALYGRVGTWKAGKGIVSVDWSAAYGDTTTEHNDFASDWSQDSWQLDLRATYAQAISERATASVFAGVQYYTHDDAVVDNMHISSLQNLRLTAGAGLNYAATARTNVYGQASVYFDAMRHNPHVDANGACFKGTNPGRIGGVLSVGADYAITDRWTLRGAYSFDVAKNSNEHNVNAGVQYSF
ncbi:MAG: autotransporter outer membrane beta-barrel domain-containing protein [Akkermansia sp.]|nr:autotransporter outer membrane beta-barrel domain-containing protein [Akkermansia sp.]